MFRNLFRRPQSSTDLAFPALCPAQKWNWARRWRQKRAAGPQPIRSQRKAIPSVNLLEPRIVLSATAELGALGQLLILGSESSDVIELTLNDDGNINVRDELGTIIPITNHPDGPGNESSPLDPNAVSSRQLIVEGRGGDDQIEIELPSGLSISLVGGFGNDVTQLRFQDSGVDSASLFVDSESIFIDSSLRSLDFSSSSQSLNGDVFIGSVGERTDLNLGFGGIGITGRLIVSGEVSFASQADLNLSDLVLTAGQRDSDLEFLLGSSSMEIGTVDSSGGHAVDDFSIRSASAITLQGDTVSLGGDLRLDAPSVVLSDTQVVSTGGVIDITGTTRVSGDVLIDTGDSQSVATGGRVRFLDSVVAEDSVDDRLRIDTRGMSQRGAVQFFGNVSDLNELEIDAGLVRSEAIDIVGGDIRIAGTAIRLVGDHVETSNAGDVLLEGPLLLPIGDTRITAAGSVRTMGTTSGQTGSGDLRIRAADDVVLGGQVKSVNDIEINAGRLALWSGRITIGGTLNVVADSIQALGDVNTSSADSGSGDIDLKSTLLTSIENDAVLFSGTSSISIDGGGGVVEVSGGTLRSDFVSDVSTESAIAIRDASRIRLGNLVAKQGSVALGVDQDVTGPIDQGADTSLVLNRLFTSTAGSIDLSNRVNEISSLERVLAGGEISVFDAAGDLDVVSVDSSGSDVHLQSDGAMSTGLITANGADVVLTSQTIDDRQQDQEADIVSGSVSMAALAGIGQIRSLEISSINEFSATSQTNGIDVSISSDQDVQARDIDARQGNIHLTYFGLNDEQTFELASVVAGDGSILIEADANIRATNVVSENISMLDDDTRDITLIASGPRSDILVGSILAANGSDANLFAGDDIFDFDIDDSHRIVADDLRLVADNQTLDDFSAIRLSTQVDDLVLSVASPLVGNVVIDEIDDVRIGSSDRQDASDQVVTINGDIAIAAGGTITVASRESSQFAVTTGGDGSLRLTANGVDSNLQIDRGISTAGGSIYLMAENEVRMSPAGDVFSRGGNVIVGAASLVMSDGALIDSETGSVLIETLGDVGLGGIRTDNETENAVTIDAGGRVADLGDEHVDIDAAIGGVQIRSGQDTRSGGIGDSNAIETRVDRMTADITTSGRIEIVEFDDIQLRRLTTFDGSITVSAEGTIQANEIVSTNVSQLDSAEHRDISITTSGESSDILVGEITAIGVTDVNLNTSDDVLPDQAQSSLLIADDLQITIGNQSADGPLAGSLQTNVNDLEANVLGDNRGDLMINEVDSINLAASDRFGDEIVEINNGQFIVMAGTAITVIDNSADDDSADRKTDPEIVARGDDGRIDLEAGASIDLQDAVQLQASKITRSIPAAQTSPSLDAFPSRQETAVFLKSIQAVFGDGIEIFTGTDQGTARYFAPRPTEPTVSDDLISLDPSVSAFFDPTTVKVNVLEQAAVNDATGILTLDLGQSQLASSGERGLSVDIDWGAETERFQRLSGLNPDATIFVGVDAVGTPTTPSTTAGGQSLLDVTHFYRQADILDSRINGRTSATAPINVLFTVRHHDSIRIESETVSQDSPSEIAAEGIATSTDSLDSLRSDGVPEQPGNGQISFIIPSLTIPVAFFPTRDVIPDFETPSVVVRTESFISLSSATVEAAESATATLVRREEFFQLRVLSPDPEGEDLAPPQRLPDDVFVGDKIQRLLEELPDGTYEVEYVLGDGNERSILRVDVRGGEATIIGGELEEGRLELKLIDGEMADQKATNPDLESKTLPPAIENKNNDRIDDLESNDRVVEETVEAAVPAGVAVAAAAMKWRRRSQPERRKQWSASDRFASKFQSACSKERGA